MIVGGPAVTLFIAFGIGTQACLVAFFAARRWAPGLAERFGWLAYAGAMLGMPLGAWLVASDQAEGLWVGPVLLGAWAVFGTVVDLWHRVEWRTPIRWSVLVPYVALYLGAQMFLWWPLWDIQRGAWLCFLVLFTANTALNLRGHTRDARAQ